MAKFHFNALDKDSSAGFTETHEAENSEELKKAWSEFSERVPFLRWYSDNTTDETADEAMLQEID